MSEVIADRARNAKLTLRKAGSAIVALSGGVDSAVLLALATEELGPERILAVTGASDAVPAEDLEDARRVATALGVRHEIVTTREMARPGYRANAGDRCYHCRVELFDILEDIRRREGFSAIAYGAIVDDLSDERPGMRAAAERGILAPLLDGGLTKNDIRSLAERFALNVHDKPASPCLASRVPTGSPVTEEKLHQIGRAETALRALGFRSLRVRHHGDVARLELDAAGQALLADPEIKAEAIRAIKEAGFRFVTVDLEGLRSQDATSAVPGRLYSIIPARDSGQ